MHGMTLKEFVISLWWGAWSALLCRRNRHWWTPVLGGRKCRACRLRIIKPII